jgi:hypothetical protein
MEKTYQNFNWEKYITKYSDLSHIKTKENAWKHWYNYGKNENRYFFCNRDLSLTNENNDENLNKLKDLKIQGVGTASYFK